jgi:hypothetical protein
MALFRQAALPTVTALVEPGTATAEIANLLYRRNVSPAVVSLQRIPAPDSSRRIALVAVNLKTPPPSVMKKILEHAEAGSTVIVATAPAGLKILRAERDRDYYALGKGQVVAYRRPVADPSEFALDVIDIITHKQRPVRLWNAPAVIAFATESPRPKERLMHLVNYGSPIDMETQVRVQGNFTKAILLRPEADPISLPTAKRGSTTEVQAPELRRLGVIVFG